METKVYETPQVAAIEVNSEGVVCESKPSNTTTREDYDYEDW